jgi:choline dehydrogenase
MGCNEMSVVDSRLKLYGIDNLRIADGSILPRVTTDNTMTHCVIVGEIKSEARPEAKLRGRERIEMKAVTALARLRR